MSFVGAFDGYISGCSATATIFGKEVPQKIADRVARTFAAIGRQEDIFDALLDGATGCAQKHCFPHSVEAASKRLQIRRAVLGRAESDH